MATYPFTREFGDIIHSNPSTYNVDHVGEPTTLAADIEAALPGIKFEVRCNNSGMEIITDPDLTTEQQTTLTNTVATHKAVVDWPPTP